ncbi:MAG TPA: FtsX-like permease family protein [Candidatus Binatia bacterium]|jgi:putative ABC transport system permease protein
MWKLASRNLLRHKSRTALTLGAIVLGIVGLILSGGFVADIFIQLREATIHSQLGHLQIYKAGYYTLGRRAPYKYMIQNPEQKIAEFRELPHVIDVMPRVNFSGLLSNGRTSFPIIGEGVDPGKEAKLSKYIIMKEGRQLEPKEAYGIMLGAGVATALKLHPGDHTTLLLNTPEGALNTLDFKVLGIFQTLSKDYDDRAVRIPLSAAWELLATNAVHSLVFALDSSMATEDVATLLRRQLPPKEFELKTWYELSDFYQKTVELYKRHFGALRLIILGMVLLSVANSVNMNIYERTGEFGTLMALGNRSGQVFRLVIAESVILGLSGGVIGSILGTVAALTISAIGIPMPPMPNTDIAYTAHIQLVPSELAFASLTGFFACILAAIWPARRASRLPVVEALARN